MAFAVVKAAKAIVSLVFKSDTDKIRFKMKFQLIGIVIVRLGPRNDCKKHGFLKAYPNQLGESNSKHSIYNNIFCLW